MICKRFISCFTTEGICECCNRYKMVSRCASCNKYTCNDCSIFAHDESELHGNIITIEPDISVTEEYYRCVDSVDNIDCENCGNVYCILCSYKANFDTNYIIKVIKEIHNGNISNLNEELLRILFREIKIGTKTLGAIVDTYINAYKT